LINGAILVRKKDAHLVVHRSLSPVQALNNFCRNAITAIVHPLTDSEYRHNRLSYVCGHQKKATHFLTAERRKASPPIGAGLTYQ